MIKSIEMLTKLSDLLRNEVKKDNDAYIQMKTFNEIKQSIMGIINSISNECTTIPKIS